MVGSSNLPRPTNTAVKASEKSRGTNGVVWLDWIDLSFSLMEYWRCEGILAGCVSMERTRWVLPAILCAGVDRRSISSLDLPAMVADLLGVVHGTPLGDGFLSNSIFSA